MKGAGGSIEVDARLRPDCGTRAVGLAHRHDLRTSKRCSSCSSPSGPESVTSRGSITHLRGYGRRAGVRAHRPVRVVASINAGYHGGLVVDRRRARGSSGADRCRTERDGAGQPRFGLPLGAGWDLRRRLTNVTAPRPYVPVGPTRVNSAELHGLVHKGSLVTHVRALSRFAAFRLVRQRRGAWSIERPPERRARV